MMAGGDSCRATEEAICVDRRCVGIRERTCERMRSGSLGINMREVDSWFPHLNVGLLLMPRVATSSKPFSCPLCSKSFKSEAATLSHLNQPYSKCRLAHQNIGSVSSSVPNLRHVAQLPAIAQETQFFDTQLPIWMLTWNRA